MRIPPRALRGGATALAAPAPGIAATWTPTLASEAQAAQQQRIATDGSSRVRAVGGFGPISGGGATSRSLGDYPEPQRSRNPDVTFYGLEWAASGWLNGGAWSQDNITYLQQRATKQ
ncbi:hypothetical protein OG535_00960 [Kitasatospora sp. NBC_00085]|uniref:hypothetical protein n=1 Tax=unclassified Kitasatospora TaxID=2633591 RepID=UPI00324E163F